MPATVATASVELSSIKPNQPVLRADGEHGQKRFARRKGEEHKQTGDYCPVGPSMRPLFLDLFDFIRFIFVLVMISVFVFMLLTIVRMRFLFMMRVATKQMHVTVSGFELS